MAEPSTRGKSRRRLLAWIFPVYLGLTTVAITAFHWTGMGQVATVTTTQSVAYSPYDAGIQVPIASTPFDPAQAPVPPAPVPPAPVPPAPVPPASSAQPAPVVVTTTRYRFQHPSAAVLSVLLLSGVPLFGPLCLLSAAWSSGALRGFHCGAVLGAGTLGAAGLVSVVLLLTMIVSGDDFQATPSNFARAMLPTALHWQWVTVAGGGLGAVLVWAAQGPQKFPSYTKYLRARRFRQWTAAGVIVIGLAAIPLLPSSFGELLLLSCGFIVLPIFAMAGAICGRPRLRAMCLPFIPLWLMMPGVAWRLLTVSGEIAEKSSTVAFSASSEAMPQMAMLVTVGSSCLFVRYLFDNLRASRSKERLSAPSRSSCTSRCAPQTTLFGGGCICDGGCEP